MILLLKGDETTVGTTATTLGNATAVRVYNASGAKVITLTDADDAQIGNTTIGVGETIFAKHPTDKIKASANVLATAIGYSVG